MDSLGVCRLGHEKFSSAQRLVKLSYELVGFELEVEEVTFDNFVE